MTTTDHHLPVDPATLVPLQEACEWRHDTVGDRYVFQLTDEHVAELDEALAEAEASTADVLDITRDDFPLPTLGAQLAHLTDDLVNGLGVALIRGVPVERLGEACASTVYWGIGTHLLGRPWPQNAKGHLLGDVTDQGRGYDDPTSRGNEIGGVPVPVPLRRVRPGGPALPRRRARVVAPASWPTRSASTTSWSATTRSWRPSCTASSPTTTAASRRRVARVGTRCPSSPAAASGCSCATSGPTSSRHAATTARAGGVGRGTRRPGPGRRDVRRPAVPRGHAARARRHAVREQLPRAPRPIGLHRRPRARPVRRHLKRLWLDTGLLTDDDKPEPFRLAGSSRWWASKGRTKSELEVVDFFFFFFFFFFLHFAASARGGPHLDPQPSRGWAPRRRASTLPSGRRGRGECRRPSGSSPTSR